MTVSAETGGASEEVRRRRRWSEAQKRRMVAECEAPGSSVSLVARRHDVNANQLFAWRRHFRKPAEGGDDQAAFVPAVIVPEAPHGDRGAPAPQVVEAGVAGHSAGRATGRMEIVLAGGHRVIVDRKVDAQALARVVAVLERR